MNHRKPRRARSSEPSPTVPTERQMDAALDGFHTSKLRHQIFQVGDRVGVKVLPAMMVGDVEFMGVKGLPPVSDKPVPFDIAFDLHWFPDEASARQWREREIIKEAVTAALRAKP